VLSRFLYPRQISRLAQKYRALFCTDVSQIAHFPGPVIVDDDDPTFSPDHIQALNGQNVVAVVTTSDLLKDRLISSGLTKPCHVVPSGVYLSRLDMGKAEALGYSLGKRQGDIVVGFATPYLYTDDDRQARSAEGRLRSITFLIAVMERVWQGDPSIQLWLMGFPSRSVKAYVDAHAQARLLGYIPHPDVLNYYANFDIAVYPRPVDFGGRHSIKLIEFMAAGVAVVSTPVSESFHVTQASAGIIADGVENFASQIVRLANDPELRNHLGEAGQRYARQFDWDELAVQYEREVFALYFSQSPKREELKAK
jgi:glycosyltransferase involved in cell wall biosynthesis